MSAASMPAATRPVVEASAWLRITARRRAIHLSRQCMSASPLLGTEVFIAYLSPGRVERGSREDRTCDRCGRYCPAGTTYGVSMFLTHYRDRRFHLVFGLCGRCGELEQPGDLWADAS